MTVEEIKKAIEALSPAEKRRLWAELVPVLSKEAIRDEKLHQEVAQQVKVFGKAAKQVIGEKLTEWRRAAKAGRESEDRSE